MSHENRLTQYVESSFLKPLLFQKGVTDVSYNGEEIFYEDNDLGRQKADIAVSSQEVGDFLRQIANFAEKQFSYSCPILDVSFSHYRLNASFLNIVRVRDQKSYSFSLRILTYGSLLNERCDFFGGESHRILKEAVLEKRPIVIAGSTSSGKTELQKYLLGLMPSSTRVIVIDNLEELELARGDGNIDLTSWQVDERFPESSFSSLIRNSLRNDPDYIVIAESRGKEMREAIASVSSGHPIITTLHAQSLEEIPSRMARLAMMGEERLSREEALDDIRTHFSHFAFLRKAIAPDGSIHRHVESLGRITKTGAMEVLYRRESA